MKNSYFLNLRIFEYLNTLMFYFIGQWLQGGNEPCACAEAARRAAVVRPG